MPDVLGGLLRNRGYYPGMPLEAASRRARSQFLPDVKAALLAPARALMAPLPKERPSALPGLLGQIDEAIRPGNVFGSYGEMLAMAMPPGGWRGPLPKGFVRGPRVQGGTELVEKLKTGELGAYKTTTARRIIRETKKEGGYSVNLATGEIPKEGIMAGMYANTDPRTRVTSGLLKPVDAHAHARTNSKALSNPKNFFGTWVKKDKQGNIIETYLDVSRKFPSSEVRSATKFAEKTGQQSIWNLSQKQELPVGSYADFVSGRKTPPDVVPYRQRVQEMGTEGRAYMAAHPNVEWWEMPYTQKVYGKARMPQIKGLLAATSTNTQPYPNVVTMSEYARRTIKGEPIIQPEYRVPETALSGPRLPKVGSRLGLETGKGGREYNLLAAARGETDPLKYRGPVVREKVEAMSGKSKAVLDRLQTYLTEHPASGIYAKGKAGQSPTGPTRNVVMGVLEDEAHAAKESLQTFSGNVWAGIRDRIARTGSLYGTDYSGTQRNIRGTGSMSYDDMVRQRVREKAAHLKITVKQMEKKLRKGDAELLSYVLAAPFIGEFARRFSDDVGDASPADVSP